MYMLEYMIIMNISVIEKEAASIRLFKVHTSGHRVHFVYTIV